MVFTYSHYPQPFTTGKRKTKGQQVKTEGYGLLKLGLTQVQAWVTGVTGPSEGYLQKHLEAGTSPIGTGLVWTEWEATLPLAYCQQGGTV